MWPIAPWMRAACSFARGSLYMMPLVRGCMSAPRGTMVPLVPSMEMEAMASGSEICAVQARMAASAAFTHAAGDCSYHSGFSDMFRVSNGTEWAAAMQPCASDTTQRTPCVPTSMPMKSIGIPPLFICIIA